MRRAARVDRNQAEIVEHMRERGASVWITGLPTDLLVGHAGKTAIVEVKRDEKAKLTKLQRDFIDNWKGGTVARVDSIGAAERLLRTMEAP